LFEQTMNRKIECKYTSEYLADKCIVPFLKVDKGLADEANGVQLMKPMPDLESLLGRANERGIFGTKMRSNVLEPNEQGIKEVVDQQFEVGKQIIAAGLVPIIEPEVNVYSDNKVESDGMLNNEMQELLDQLSEYQNLMLKLSIPTAANLYAPLIHHPCVDRAVALTGAYSREEANEKLQENDGLIAS